MSFNVKNSFVLKSLEPRYGPYICIMYTVQVLFDATLSKCIVVCGQKNKRYRFCHTGIRMVSLLYTPSGNI